MEHFSDFNNKCLASFGFSFLYRRDYHSGNFFRFISVISAVLVTIHSLCYAFSHFKIDKNTASSFVMGISAAQVICKLTVVLISQKGLWKVKMDINDLVLDISKKNQEKFSVEIKKYPCIIRMMFISTMVCTHIFNSIPIFTLIVTYFTKGIIYEKLLFVFCYPFDPYQGGFFLLFYVYETFLSHFYTVAAVTVDGFILLTLGQIAILFKSLAEDFVDVIDEYEEKKPEETEKKLNEKIEMHNRLIDLTMNFLSLYEMAIFGYVVTFAISTCFILFNAMITSEAHFILPSLFGILNTGAYLFHICYFGEKLMESVSI